jgi:hypothetical protein
MLCPTVVVEAEAEGVVMRLALVAVLEVEAEVGSTLLFLHQWRLITTLWDRVDPVVLSVRRPVVLVDLVKS